MNKILMRDSSFWSLLLCLTSATVIAPVKVNGIFIIVLFLVWIASVFIQKPDFSYLVKSPFSFFAVFLFINLMGLFYTSNISTGLKYLERFLPFVLLPIILGSLTIYSQDLRRRVLFAFSFSVILVSSLYLFIPVDTLDNILTINRTYLGIYLLFSLIILLVYTFLNNNTYSKYQRVSLSILVIYNIFLLVQTGSKMPLFLLCIVMAAFLILSIRKSTKKVVPFLFFLLGISVVILFVANSDFTSGRIDRLLDDKIDFIRYRNWKTNIELIQESPLVGYGTGDALMELQRKRETTWHEYIFEYNSHNQYLETTVQLGLLGLVSFLLCLVVQFVYSIRTKDYVYSFMILIFAGSCMTESLLNRQKGIIFFSFFSCFLFLTSQDRYNQLGKK